jgi:transcriptional regulator with XRE-family HTH domain
VSDTPSGSAATRTLALAAKTLGGAQALAKRLGVEPAALERWMAGEALPPYEVFLKALDIVAGGPRRDPARRASARRAQSHADRLQAAANRVRESAERLQCRQLQPKDGAPASNKPDAAQNKKSKG